MELNINTLLVEIALLKEQNQNLEKELIETKEHLKKYTAPQKEYYEKNKELVNQKANERLKKIALENPDKIKEYRKKAYLKQKEKKLQSQVV